MNKKNDVKSNESTCIVGFHDLLGFGNLIASSSGTFDSAVGEIAYKRLQNLSDNYYELDEEFPASTHLIHFNDTICASMDIKVDISSQLTDSSSISSTIIEKEDASNIINFLGAFARLHQKTLSTEEHKRLGPGARSIIVVGKRWDLTRVSQIDSLNHLQANLAFSEAYLIDSIGSRAGLNNRGVDNFYANDLLMFILDIAGFFISPEAKKQIDKIDKKGLPFPNNLISKVGSKELTLFHRKRKVTSLMSHYTCDLKI